MVRPTKRIVRNPQLEPEQPAAPQSRSFTKGRLMQVHVQPDAEESPEPAATEPVETEAAANQPHVSKFDARASGGGAPTAEESDGDDPVYTIRGREVIDLREADRREAEAEAEAKVTVELGDATSDRRSQTYYQRHSANLPHLADQDFEQPSPAKGHAKK